MDDQVYAVTDLSGYVTEMREAAAKSLSESSDNDDLDQYISIDQMIGLVKNCSLGKDDLDRYLLNEKSNEKVFEEAAIWIHNVGLAKLAAKDLIECAWSDEDNEMVFWVKEQEKKSNAQQKRRRKNMGDQK